MALDYYKLVEDKIGEFADLHARMEADKDLAALKEFSLVDKDDRTAPNVENVTLNAARVFFDRVCATLNGANMQCEVEGEKLKDEDTSLIEDFTRALTIAADQRLQTQDIPGVGPMAIQQMAGRGGVARRVCLYMDEKTGKFVCDIRPYDRLYMYYEIGTEDYKWVAPRLYRTKALILDEYGIEINTTHATLTDFWDDENERIFIERDEAKVNKNPYGRPPWVMQLNPTGLFFQDSDFIKNNGESIFAADRGLYEAMNKVASILMTLTVMSFYGGMQLEIADAAMAEKPQQSPYGKRVIMPIEKGTKGYFSMPVQDVNNACRWLVGMLEKALQKGSLPEASYGNITFPMSAVGIKTIQQTEDPVYLPLLQGLSLLEQRTYRMAIDQYISQKMNVSLGQPGFQKEYPYEKLDKDYSIKFRFFSNSPTQQMADISMADAASRFYSEDTVQRDILKNKNPTKEINKRRADRAEAMDPAIALYKLGHSLIDEDRDIEVELVLQQLEMMLRVRTMQAQMPSQPAPANQVTPIDNKPKGDGLIPMLEQGRHSVRQPVATTEESNG